MEHLEDYLKKSLDEEDVHAACEQIAKDAGQESLATWQAITGRNSHELICSEVQRLMAEDAKATGLKALQGLIWKGGFESGTLKAHTFEDVMPTIRTWVDSGFDVRIYSSGSIAAQKLFFGHLDGLGNCLEVFSGHFDTTIGGKKESQSYINVANEWGIARNEILFVSDIAEELTAAREAGLHALASVRPGNHPLPEGFDIPTIESFEEIRIQA